MASNASNAQMAKAAANTAPAVVFHKTQMCRFHILGKCNRGTSCLFAHSADDLQARPDFSCTRVCRRLIETGRCDIPQCKFAHNKDQLRHRKPTENELEARRNRKDAGSLQNLLKVSQAMSWKRDEAQRKQLVSSKHMQQQHSEDYKDELATCWDQPTWTRQSTEERQDSDLGFCSEVSEESQAWPTIDEVEAKSKILNEKSLGRATLAVGMSCQQCLLPEVSYKVKNTFIEVTDVDADQSQTSAMRRCASVPAMAIGVN